MSLIMPDPSVCYSYEELCKRYTPQVFAGLGIPAFLTPQNMKVDPTIPFVLYANALSKQKINSRYPAFTNLGEYLDPAENSALSSSFDIMLTFNYALGFLQKRGIYLCKEEASRFAPSP
jgi:hypothetical protein